MLRLRYPLKPHIGKSKLTLPIPTVQCSQCNLHCNTLNTDGFADSRWWIIDSGCSVTDSGFLFVTHEVAIR